QPDGVHGYARQFFTQPAPAYKQTVGICRVLKERATVPRTSLCRLSGSRTEDRYRVAIGLMCPRGTSAGRQFTAAHASPDRRKVCMVENTATISLTRRALLTAACVGG